MDDKAVISPPIFSKQLTVHKEIEDLIEIEGSKSGPAGIAALSLQDQLQEPEIDVDFAEPEKLTNIFISLDSLSEYRGFLEVLIGNERTRAASELFRKEGVDPKPRKIQKSEKSLFWTAERPFVNYVLAESRAEESPSGDLRELFARIESFSSLNSFAKSVEKNNKYEAARNIRDIQRRKDENLKEILGDLRLQVPEIAAEDAALLSVLKSQLRQFERQEMSAEFRATMLLSELHLQVKEQAERSRFSGALSRQNRESSGSVRAIRNRGFSSDLERYFALPVNEQQAFFDGEEILLQEHEVERSLDTLRVFFVSPLSVGKWIRVTERNQGTPVALAEIVQDRQGASAKIRLPFQRNPEDFRFQLTSDPLRAKDQTPLTVRIRAIREGRVAAQRERAGDDIGASWHWLHCSNLWKIIDEGSNEKKAGKWAKKCFDKSTPVSEDFGFASAGRSRLLPRPDLALQSMSLSSFEFDDVERIRGLKSRGSAWRTVKAKGTSKTRFLTDTAWSVLDDLGL